MVSQSPMRSEILEDDLRRLNDQIVQSVSASVAEPKRHKILISGTGRCGTESAFRALTHFGIPSSHEGVYTAWGYVQSEDVFVESSFLAVPFLKIDPAFKVHLVRHPIDVINSFMAIRFFHPDTQNVHKDFIQYWFRLTGNEVLDAFRWWVEWNTFCELDCDVRYRIQDLKVMTADILHRYYDGKTKVDLSSYDFGSRHNQKNGEKTSQSRLTLADAPNREIKDKILEMSERYGFEF